MSLEQAKETAKSGILLAVVIGWLYWVWPTPWEHMRLGTQEVRTNRFTGTTEYATAKGWRTPKEQAADQAELEAQQAAKERADADRLAQQARPELQAITFEAQSFSTVRIKNTSSWAITQATGRIEYWLTDRSTSQTTKLLTEREPEGNMKADRSADTDISMPDVPDEVSALPGKTDFVVRYILRVEQASSAEGAAAKFTPPLQLSADFPFQTHEQPVRHTFHLGSTEAEVREVMGTPSGIDNYGMLGNTWHYGLASVEFKDGKVTAYDNYGGILQVQ